MIQSISSSTFGQSSLRDVGVVLVVVLEVVLLEHRRFVDVVVGGDPVVVGDFGELLDIVHIVPADVHVEENGRAVLVLLPQKMIEIRAHRREGFRQARLFVDAIHGEIDRGDARIEQPVRHFRPKQPGIGGEIDPEALLRRVVGNLVNQLRTQQRFAAHKGEHAARSGIAASRSSAGPRLRSCPSRGCRMPSNSGNRGYISTP